MLITRSSKMNATRAWNGPPARQFEYAGQAACLDPIPRLGRPSVRISARLRRLFPRPTARLGIFIMSSIRELPMVFRWPPDSTAHGSMLPITRQQYDALVGAFGKGPAK